MSVTLKSARELELMRIAGRIVANALVEVRESVRPGMTTKDVDRIADRAITHFRVRCHRLERRERPAGHGFQAFTRTVGSIEVTEASADRGGAPAREFGQESDLGVVDARATPSAQVEIGYDHVLVE